jgi:hypothetical protein
LLKRENPQNLPLQTVKSASETGFGTTAKPHYFAVIATVASVIGRSFFRALIGPFAASRPRGSEGI